MAIFASQISAQVTDRQKRELRDVVAEDQVTVLKTSEADVIRLALELGLPLVKARSTMQRCKDYGSLRQGLDATAETSQD